ALLEGLRDRLGPWTLTGPARYALRHALADRDWQSSMRAQLLAQGARLARLLSAHGLAPSGGSAFFQWRRDRRALQWQQALAERGILT
ncbi:threonine-phosphate decarboxylase, partial [Lysobacter sp. 2RAB21]